MLLPERFSVLSEFVFSCFKVPIGFDGNKLTNYPSIKIINASVIKLNSSVCNIVGLLGHKFKDKAGAVKKTKRKFAQGDWINYLFFFLKLAKSLSKTKIHATF